MLQLFTLTDTPQDLLGTILLVVVGLLVAAVGWITRSVIDNGKDIAALKVMDTSHEQTCTKCRAEIDRRINEQHNIVDQRILDVSTTTDRRFKEVTDTLKAINDKLDRVLEKK